VIVSYYFMYGKVYRCAPLLKDIDRKMSEDDQESV